MKFLKFSSLAMSFLFCCGTAMADDLHRAQTRFGLADGSENVLKINGHPTTPEVDGDGGMFVEKISETADADYLLLTDVGGSVCPALYSIVKVAEHSVTPMAYFGNCNVDPKRTIVPGKSITLAFEAYHPLRYKGAPMATYVYDIPTGVLKKNGRVVSTDCKGKCW